MGLRAAFVEDHVWMNDAGERGLSIQWQPFWTKDKEGRSVHLRLYGPADYEALGRMYDDYEPKGLECGLPPPNERVRRRWLDHLVSEFFNVLALHEGRIIGHAALALSDRCLCPEYLIFIQKGFRNGGIGTTLSQAMKKAAEAGGCEKIVLTVRTANRRAIRVFEKVGFGFLDGIQPCRDMALELRPTRHRRKRKG
ncbi:MAG: GNAT family N-acetyltransferase [Thermodesulfobacteriota bacterium]|nr:GNAT family N-acetyltransferase [Thermodesulfobacteriota bacterium]